MVRGIHGDHNQPVNNGRITAPPPGGYDLDPTFRSLANQVQMEMDAYNASPDDFTGAALKTAIAALASYLGMSEDSPGTPPSQTTDPKAFAIYNLLNSAPFVGKSTTLANLCLTTGSAYSAIDIFNQNQGVFASGPPSSPFYSAINATANSNLPSGPTKNDIHSLIQGVQNLIAEYNDPNISQGLKDFYADQIAGTVKLLLSDLNSLSGKGLDGFTGAISLLLNSPISRTNGNTLWTVMNNYLTSKTPANLAALETALDPTTSSPPGDGCLADLASVLGDALHWEKW